MKETTTLHFDLSHLEPDQWFTLHAGLRQYVLSPHTPRTRIIGRRMNSAFHLFPESRITHFADTVGLPGHAPILLRLTAPKLRPHDHLDRLVWTGIYIPRRYRISGVANRKRQFPAAIPPNSPSPVALALAFLCQTINWSILRICDGDGCGRLTHFSSSRNDGSAAHSGREHSQYH